MRQTKVLVVEDDKRLARLLELELEHAGYKPRCEHDGAQGLRSVRFWEPDLILLDRMLPGMDGLEVCRNVRLFSAVPILMLTAREETVDKVEGLDSGADDYITKPFQMEELLARMRAALRGNDQLVQTKLLVVQNLTLDPFKRTLCRDDTEIKLTKHEFDLLEYMMRNRSIVLTRGQILDYVWSEAYEGEVTRRVTVGEADDELSRLAQTFNHMIERLQCAFERQKRFVSDASHELRTPIAVIQGYADLIQRWGKNDPDVLCEAVDSIKSETESMKALVERLLFLARSSDGTMQLQLECFHLWNVLQEVAEETQFVFGRSIDMQMPETLMLTADRALIKQMLRALADNAMKYMPENGSVSMGGVQVTEGHCPRGTGHWRRYPSKRSATCV